MKETDLEREKDPAAVELGRKGGRKGGKARAAALTPEQRRESARNAGIARAAALTPERRREIAAMGGRAARRKRPAAAPVATPIERAIDGLKWEVEKRLEELAYLRRAVNSLCRAYDRPTLYPDAEAENKEPTP